MMRAWEGFIINSILIELPFKAWNGFDGVHCACEKMITLRNWCNEFAVD